MPGFDGTGPRGLGPMTGGGRGFCGVPPGGAGMAYRSGRFAGVYGAGYSGLTGQTELEQLKMNSPSCKVSSRSSKPE